MTVRRLSNEEARQIAVRAQLLDADRSHDRARTRDLFEFEYYLEMYKPAAKRRWGFFALPVLHHDQLVGKVDAAADRKTGVLNVQAVHQDVPFTRTMTAAVGAELDALARWLGLDRVHHE